MLHQGSTFLYAESDATALHLHVVLTPPEQGKTVVVSITTVYPYSKLERILILHPGDHPFLTHEESAPAYQFAEFLTTAEIEAAFANGEAKLREDASPALVTRILNALIESDFTPNHVRAYCRALADKSGI